MSNTTQIELPRNQGTLTVRTYTQATETRAIDITVIELTFTDGHGNAHSVAISGSTSTDEVRSHRFQVVLDNHETANFEPLPEPEPVDMALINEVYERLMAEKNADPA